MISKHRKTVLILGANSDVAKAAIVKFIDQGYLVLAASRNTEALKKFSDDKSIHAENINILFFDAAAFNTHASFYKELPQKPHIVVYAAGFLKDNQEAMHDFPAALQMMNVHYAGAVSILNIIIADEEHGHLERIIGLSSLSGVRGRRSNFIYGSTKAAFTTYLAGLRQLLFKRNIIVNVIVAGYIRSKMTAHLSLPESLLLEPEYIAKFVAEPGDTFTIVPSIRWKFIYHLLRWLPEKIVSRLP